jgi:hypothetical protein
MALNMGYFAVLGIHYQNRLTFLYKRCIMHKDGGNFATTQGGSMRLIQSKQRDVAFVFCSAPIIIDKRAEWGPDPSNLQNAQNGAFLKMSSPVEVSHLVQPNETKTAPVGWVPGSAPGLFSKSPIWVEDEILEPGMVKNMKTLDGELNYEVKEPAVVCYNGTEDGPNLVDGWVQTLKVLKKNYEF